MASNYEVVSEQIEQSFQMLHNALYSRQNQLLSLLPHVDTSEEEDSFSDGAKMDMYNSTDEKNLYSELKFFAVKMDNVLKEIRDFGTISMTTTDPNMTTISHLNLLNQFPIIESVKVSLLLKDSKGDPVTERGILDPKVFIEMKDVVQPQCDIIESDLPHQMDLEIRLPRVGEYELSVMFCESSILGSPFTLIGSVKEPEEVIEEPVPDPEPTNLECLFKIGTKGIKPSDFGNPQSIMISNERILVTDSGNACIQIYNSNCKYVTCFGPKEKKMGKLLRPIDIAETSNGHYLVTDYELKVVIVYDLNGNYVSFFGQKILFGPKGICVDKTGQIIVADNKDSSLVFFRATGKFIRRIKDKPKTKNKLAGPHFLVILSSEDILVTDFYNHCVRIYDKNGVYQKEFGNHGDGWGELNYPTGICRSENDDIIVSDWGNSRIVIFNYLFTCTKIIKPLEEPLCGPQGVILNEDESQILIVDSGNHCFKAFQFK